MNNCGCNKPKPCGCNQKPCGGSKLDLKCTEYRGSHLLPLDIPEGTDGETVIKIINDFIRNLMSDINQNNIFIENVGGGTYIYKGLSSELKHQFKSIVKGTGIKISENENEIKLEIDPEWVSENIKLVSLHNKGTGVKLYDEIQSTTTEKYIKTISNTESIKWTETDNDVKANVDKTWFDNNVPEPPVINGNSVGEGTPLYAGLNDKKIDIKSIKGGAGVRISVSEDNKTVIIDTPQFGSSSSTNWFIDANFVRPSNWADDETREVINYTTPIRDLDLPLGTYKLPHGTLSDPFINFEEFLLKYIGQGSASDGEPYSRVNPRAGSITLQFLSDITTASALEVNSTSFVSTSKVSLLYTGGNEYGLSHAKLFQDVPRVGGKIKRSINMNIFGAFEYTRTSYQGSPRFGLIDIEANETETTSSLASSFSFITNGEGISLIESTNTGANLYVPLTESDGTTLLFNGNSQVLGTTQAPVTPLVRIKGTTHKYWAALVAGTSKLYIETKSQVGIECLDYGKITSSNEGGIYYQVSNSHIAYSKKMWKVGGTYFPSGLSAYEQGLVDANIHTANPTGLIFKPHDDYSVFKGTNNANFRLEKLGTYPNGFDKFYINSIASLKTVSAFNNITSIQEVGGGGALSFFKTDSSCYLHIGAGVVSSRIFYLVSGHTNFTDKAVECYGTLFSAVIKLAYNITNLTVETGGMLSSFAGRPMITVPIYASNADALADPNLLPSMLYASQDNVNVLKRK